MISIVTGTLNRVGMLPMLVENTVMSDERIELVLVDGGSTDGTIDYIKSLDNPQIKLIEVGGRSTYPHFMNLGIQASCSSSRTMSESKKLLIRFPVVFF
jgi:glycosyltransferase involved in cell wall biosynthesis